MGEGKRGKPGSELERLEIFQELATEYFSMVALFEPDGEPPVHSAEAERRRWLELFRAALLRKFIVRDEHVSLKLVVRALRLCNYSADRHLAEGADGVVALFTPEMVQGRQHVAPGEGPAPDEGPGEGPAPDEGPDRFEDVLYGRLLHGDADRFHRSAWANDTVRLSAAAAARFDAERALSAALELVRYGMANNLLKSPRTAGGEGGPPGPAGGQSRPSSTSQYD
ncbi:hypothetical protein [uncultured Arthrobacter sp.]|uniref:hypothetical protein n=1 Tax=uncultured Arthrobacter sp. TaxID=114050 RepID=UPI003217D849